jgi:acylphosphatase
VIGRRVLVSGEVQGVFFRQSCRREAQALGVSGWVRNRADGRVEAVLEGETEAVEQVLAWMRTGPPSATVTDVEARPEEPSGLRGFRVR